MSYALPLASPYFEGAGAAPLVPGVWDCSLNGRTYMFDWKYADRFQRASFQRASISLLRPQADTSAGLGEQSLNPEEFGRRSAESWHHGAGQTFLDRPDSDPHRFRASKGVDVWTKYQWSLLNDTTLVDSSGNTNLAVLSVGSYLYEADGNEVYWKTSTGGARTGATIQHGETAQSVKSVTSDGDTVYAALGSNGIHTTTRGASTSAHYSDLAATLVGYVKGRLMAAQANSIFNVIASGAAPSALLTHPNSDFTWVGFAGGPAAIYAAGYSGDKSLIYRTAVKADGTALDVPVVAGELPDGEIVRTIEGYLGFLLLGTDKGWRLAQLDSSGNVNSMGKIIPTGSAVLCFEPQDHFAWFGLSNYDAASTGLGRGDLGTESFTSPLTPAYTSDLMAAGQGAVLSVATFAGVRVFAVSGLGFYAEAATKVASGYLDSGLITFGLPDPKVAVWLDVRHEALAGSIAVSVSADGGTWSTVGTSNGVNSTGDVFALGNMRGQTHEVRLTAAPSGSTSPVVHRWTLEANPAPGRGETFDVPLQLAEKLSCHDGDEATVDVAAELEALLSIEETAVPVSYVTGMGTESVFLDDHTFIVDQYNDARTGFMGTFVARLRRPRKRS